MVKMPMSVIRAAAFCLPLALVASCGSGPEAVQGTTVNFMPSQFGQATTLGTAGSNVKYMTVAALSPTGYPQIGVKLVIDSQYIVYEGHPDVASLPGLTPLTLPYPDAITSSNGTYDITVLYSWGTAINGDFTAAEAWSGTGYGNSTVTYTCTDPDTATAPACP